MRNSIALLLSSAFLAAAHPAAGPAPTPAPTRVIKERGVVADLTSEVAGVFASIGKTIPTEAAQGILPGLENLPSDSDIKSKLNLTDADIAALPINVLNIPGYANYTADSWLLRLHGQAYRTPLTSGPALDNLANGFIPNADISQLLPWQQDNARNLTAEIYSLPVEGVQLYFDLTANNSDLFTIIFPELTDPRGEFDMFVALDSQRLLETDRVQKLDVYTNGTTDTGNSTAYLVPTEGITIISDIDDILRVTKIYQPEEGLNNTFVNNFTAWLNMPEVYAKWYKEDPGLHFHYLTTTPEPGTRAYMQFIYATYPLGSFDTRPYNFTTADQIFEVRDVALKRVIETYPQRKFILIADTSNSDVMRDYPQLAHQFGSQIQCILLRNTSESDPSDHFPYDTSGFEGLDNSTYMFFNLPDDILGLNFSKGDCRNYSIPQNVEYKYQGLPTLSSAATWVETTLLRSSVLAVLAGLWILI